MPNTFTKEDLERVQNTFGKIINKYRVALADAIICPKDTIPDSAKDLVSQNDLEMAESRRKLFYPATVAQLPSDHCRDCDRQMTYDENFCPNCGRQNGNTRISEINFVSS